MTAPSSNKPSVVSIRHVAPGFMGGCHVVLVMTNGVAHLVACRLNSRDIETELPRAAVTADELVDRQFVALNTVTLGPEGLGVLGGHVNELRSSGSISQPIKWCCPADSMRDFSGVSKIIQGTPFEVGRLIELPVQVKRYVLAFSRCYFAQRRVVDNRVRGRFSRVTLRIETASN